MKNILVNVIKVILLIMTSVGAFIMYGLESRPPRYDPLLSVPIVQLTVGTGSTFEFMNHYEGAHAIVLTTQSPLPIGRGYPNSPLDISVEVRADSEVLFEANVEAYAFPFWGREFSGVAIMRYNVPVELPKDKKLELSIVIGDLANQFITANKFSDLLILKFSDE